jgi:hypothetical protein
MNKFSPEGELLSSIEVLSNQYGDLPPPEYEGKDAQEYLSKKYYDSLAGQDMPEAEKSVLLSIQLKNKEKNNIIRALAKRYPKSSIIQSGDFYYPAKGFMGWHTNSNTPGRRVYLSYSLKSNTNSFNYIKDGEVIKDFDCQGWTAREFIVSDKRNSFFWHSVDAQSPRISIGFRVFDNL